ncbi:MAG: glucose dehydrogenase, partial [Acidimicrobiia bacterium]|nr:PQQ-dependent sugar dehydrogenase [Acidimicrobiia bacterium]NNF10158.1 glucose dehydrogenase [Acidimicrobiia bacterium]NNL69745.1 glucose dehydrogenase [Acidimicrobiia bacterium]
STSSTTTTTLPPLQSVELELVADGFQSGVWAGVDPASGELLVIERRGIIRTIDGEVRLDIDARVGSGSSEQGLLGIAFSPVDPSLFYLNYTDTSGDTVIAEFSRAGGAMDPASEVKLLEIDQPASNHNGGNLAFGPDGLLYVGMGDGGAANDRFGNGQDPSTRLGAMLRLDPSTPSGDLPYTVPAGNPLSGAQGDELVFAYGLRNPWRYAFDGNLLYIADVGQGDIEEVSVVSIDEVAPGRAPNFGWPILEGTDCFASANCDRSGLIEPVAQYTHAEGCSITGGVVMHDPSIPELDGFYIYGDFCRGFVRGFFLDGGEASGEAELFTGVGSISSFGVDADGAVLVVTLDGAIYRIVAVR